MLVGGKQRYHEAMNDVDQHFEGKEPQVRRIYDALLRAARSFGAVTEDPKKTSIHLTRRTAFAGVAPRKDAVILTLKSARDIVDPRIRKHQHTSANRWHLDVSLSDAKHVDGQLKGWLRDAYDLAG
jgi:hypothetical protein